MPPFLVKVDAMHSLKAGTAGGDWVPERKVQSSTPGYSNSYRDKKERRSGFLGPRGPEPNMSHKQNLGR